jgi:hypothetical protein
MFAGDALPGLRVDIAPPPAAETLPRMDIALFAGFAERGPCHVAIALSSAAAYGAVFGGDCPLAWDEEGGRKLTGNLAAAVRAFFANGGTRCWAIRIAETAALAAVRAAETGVADPESRPARAGRFALSGLLRRLPNAAADSTLVSPAILSAASLGSWSDAMRLAARVSRYPVAIERQAKARFGLRLTDFGVLKPGDLVELSGGEGLVKRYAKVLRTGGGTVWAMWIASFARIMAATPTKTGHVSLPGLPGAFAAEFDEGPTCSVRVDDPAGAAALAAGAWVNFHHAGESIWLRADRVDGNFAQGPGWQQVGSRLPGGPIAAARVTIDVAEHRPGSDRVHSGLALAPEAGAAIHRLVDADLFYADPDRRDAAMRPGFAIQRSETVVVALGMTGEDFTALAARFGTADFTNADRIALRSAWLPVGLDSAFLEARGRLPDLADPLVRDGLSRFDERLFLDPRYAALGGPAMAARAALREAGEAPPLGIHAALDLRGDLFPEPSLLAVPDAVQPGWALGTPPDQVPEPSPGTIDAPADRGGFLDCAIRALDKPVLTAPAAPLAEGSFTLSWDAQPTGSVVVLEESERADFSTAVELLRETGVTHYDLTGRAQGAHYYRLHVEQDGNVSPYAAALVLVRRPLYSALAADGSALARIHCAMLRLAGADGAFLALLSLPQAWRAVEASAYSFALTTTAPGAGSAGQLGSGETGLLSFGALYHPWLVERGADGLASAPPEGAAAGLMAARARQRGAWIAPANEPLQGIVGLDPAVPASDLLALDRARVNMVRRLPVGFTVHDADTLSPERDWRPINVRRLMMLLRRMLVRRGLTHVFEPNGPVLRRAVERSLTATLDDMQLRGAFAGATSEQSFRVSVQASAGDLDGGRLIVEISVAPSQPVRFLTLRLIQQGARLSIEEDS